MDLLIGLVGLLSLIGIPYLAKKRGRNPFLFFLLTLFIGPFAGVFLLKRKKINSQSKSVHAANSVQSGEIDVVATFGNDDYVEPTDARTAVCPSCGFGLNKVPGAKTKCPHCAAFMYVRTDPETNSRVVVTAERAEEIEDEWSKINGTWEYRQEEKRRYEATKEQLTKNFKGVVPSDNDIKWSLLNEDSIKHASVQDWGLYRNTIFQMGEILRKEEKHSMAIEKYLLVCYMDTCGPNNVGVPLGQKLEFGQKAFSKEFAFLAPGVLERVQKSAKAINKDLDDLKVVILDIGVKYKGAIPFTISPEESWEEIIKELKKL
jgi:hypothetical protein